MPLPLYTTLPLALNQWACHVSKFQAPLDELLGGRKLQFAPYHFPKLHPGPCSSVGMRRGTDTQTAVTNTHFASATLHAKCKKVGI